MKIKVLHSYQTVRFNKKDETHFTADKPSMSGLSMTWLPEYMAVRLDMPGTESVLVFCTNVAYAVIADEVAPKSAKKA